MRGVLAITAALHGVDPVRRVLTLSHHGLKNVLVRDPISEAELQRLTDAIETVIVHQRWSPNPPDRCGLHHASGVRVAPGDRITGASCHSAEQVDDALRTANYALLSPVFRPISKPRDMRPVLGPDQFLAIAGGRPVFALGGLTPARWTNLRRRGASGVAVCGSLMQADELVAIATLEALLQA